MEWFTTKGLGARVHGSKSPAVVCDDRSCLGLITSGGTDFIEKNWDYLKTQPFCTCVMSVASEK